MNRNHANSMLGGEYPLESTHTGRQRGVHSVIVLEQIYVAWSVWYCHSVSKFVHSSIVDRNANWQL